jgi:hypothetical protein
MLKITLIKTISFFRDSLLLGQTAILIIQLFKFVIASAQSDLFIREYITA